MSRRCNCSDSIWPPANNSRASPGCPGRGHEVVATWEEVLDALEQLQLSGDIPSSLIGTVDWVTKKQLIDEAGHDTSWEARKKVDICYHELSPLGYFQMLQAAGLAASLPAPKNWTALCGHPLPTRPPRCAVTISASSLRMEQNCP